MPIVMAAEIFMGIYFNLSFWYKLIDETRWGAYFSLIGCAVLVVMNILLIPRYSYMACAGQDSVAMASPCFCPIS